MITGRLITNQHLLYVANEDMDWLDRAACRDADPNIFFPERGNHNDYIPARKLCAVCVVSSECLDYALRNNEQLGMWGGLVIRERRPLRQRTAQRAAAGLGPPQPPPPIDAWLPPQRHQQPKPPKPARLSTIDKMIAERRTNK